MSTPASGSYLLDTNIVIALLEKDAAVQARLAGATVFVYPAVLGELYYGARKSQRVDKNIERVDDFAQTTAILDCDLATAQEYGIIRDQIRAAGRPIPENDVWIAATARQHNLTLATRDAHFAHVPALQTEAW